MYEFEAKNEEKKEIKKDHTMVVSGSSACLLAHAKHVDCTNSRERRVN